MSWLGADLPSEEDRRETVEMVASVLYENDLDEAGLADLLGAERRAILRWLETGWVERTCDRKFLRLLADAPDLILPLLRERLEKVRETPDRDWPAMMVAIKERTGLTHDGIMRLTGTPRKQYHQYYAGEFPPFACHAVMFDLLHDRTDEMIALLEREAEPLPEPEEWSKKRLMALAARVGRTMSGLAELIGVSYRGLRAWFERNVPPEFCPDTVLLLLELHPDEMSHMLERLGEPDREAWTGSRARALRQKLELTHERLAWLFGTTIRNIQRWETVGLPGRTPCPTVLYGLMERHPETIVELLEELRT